MSSLAVAVLPYALGAAVSPTLLTVEILILSGNIRPKSRAWGFALGAGSFLLGYTIVLATFLRNASDANGAEPSALSSWIKGVAALLLILLGVRALRSGGTTDAGHKARVKARLATAPWVFFVGIGLVMMLSNFSTLVLYWPGMHEITQSVASDETKLVVTAMLFLIAMAPALVPVLLVTILGKASDRILQGLNAFTSTHAKQINAGICFLFAALIAYSGVSALLA